ncbi:exopolysaccharide production protein YjbE, partial [Enterobacter kobei]|uniref:exopolysaccharide production protein YjbE n=1 Tax=Enterobacter kobei TaxID=208224 RepID=UPI001F07B77C
TQPATGETYPKSDLFNKATSAVSSAVGVALAATGGGDGSNTGTTTTTTTSTQ